MPQKLSDVELDEVSLVDNGANQKAKVVLMKRDAQPDGACKGTKMPCDACKGTGKVGNDICKDCAGKGELMKCGDTVHKLDETCKACDEVAKAPAGIKFNIGFPEEGGSEVQSVIFDSANWDKAKAVQWLKDHEMESGKVDETTNTLRFRQKDPAGFKRFRVITPGANVGKALKAAESFNRLQNLVDMELREEFQTSGKDAMGNPVPKGDGGMLSASSYVWIRDLFKDSVIFDQDGQTFRAEYSVERDSDGELAVTFDTPVPVEVVYQDVKKSEPPPVEEPPVAEPPKPEEVPVELLMKLGRLQAQVGILSNRVGKIKSPVGFNVFRKE